MALDLILMNTNIIHLLKIHPKLPPTTLVLKYIFIFSDYVTSIILSQIYFMCSNSSIFIGIFL